METLQEIILKSVVGRKINAHDETVIVKEATIGNNWTGFNGSYVFSILLHFDSTLNPYLSPLEIGLDDNIFVSQKPP
jgi:hypothetical protein